MYLRWKALVQVFNITSKAQAFKLCTTSSPKNNKAHYPWSCLY